tara:strand:+ start:2012 stop:2239 length:228 start_codon:yes stop_codon:yes gene_type:complete
MRDVQYKVTYAIAALAEPEVRIFDTHDESTDWIDERIQEQIDFAQDDANGNLTVREICEVRDDVMSLMRFEEVWP